MCRTIACSSLDSVRLMDATSFSADASSDSVCRCRAVMSLELSATSGGGGTLAGVGPSSTMMRVGVCFFFFATCVLGLGLMTAGLGFVGSGAGSVGWVGAGSISEGSVGSAWGTLMVGACACGGGTGGLFFLQPLSSSEPAKNAPTMTIRKRAILLL